MILCIFDVRSGVDVILSVIKVVLFSFLLFLIGLLIMGFPFLHAFILITVLVCLSGEP
jgi:hypothetical protein